MPIPKDVEAWMVQATIELARSKGFEPKDKSELARWMTTHAKEISERAIDLQMECFLKYKKRQREIDKMISESVYNAISEEAKKWR